MALDHALDPDLVAAVIAVESLGNPYAIRYEKGFRHTYNVPYFAKMVGCTTDSMWVMQKTSWGLMQVMGAVAYEEGLADMNGDERWPSAMLNPKVGIEMGCRHLKRKFEAFGPEVARVYAAYNAGTPRLNDSGKFVNQVSVDRFLRYYRELKA